MFWVGEKIVHPMHGAGIVDEIVKNKSDGVVREYYKLRLAVGDMLVMIPVDHCAEIGVRAIASCQQTEEILQCLPNLDAAMQTNWNHRYRENLQRLKSGDLLEVARVVKGLTARERERDLSTGERKMFRTAKQIFASEIELAQSISYAAAEERIDRALKI